MYNECLCVTVVGENAATYLTVCSKQYVEGTVCYQSGTSAPLRMSRCTIPVPVSTNMYPLYSGRYLPRCTTYKISEMPLFLLLQEILLFGWNRIRYCIMLISYRKLAKIVRFPTFCRRLRGIFDSASKHHIDDT